MNYIRFNMTDFIHEISSSLIDYMKWLLFTRGNYIFLHFLSQYSEFC